MRWLRRSADEKHKRVRKIVRAGNKWRILSRRLSWPPSQFLMLVGWMMPKGVSKWRDALRDPQYCSAT